MSLPPFPVDPRPVVLTRPGPLERVYVTVTAFLLLYSLPNEWFVEFSLTADNPSVNESSGSLPTLVFTLLLYLPGGPIMYGHMSSQRKKQFKKRAQGKLPPRKESARL